MDREYQHPNIHIYMMSLKPSNLNARSITTNTTDPKKKDADVDREEREVGQSSGKVEELLSGEVKEEIFLENPQEIKKLTEWEARRHGSMAARLLRDVKIT